jgi:hypothetical protein
VERAGLFHLSTVIQCRHLACHRLRGRCRHRLYVGYGTRWIERFDFLAGAAVVLIWIGALPPASEWRNSIVAVVHAALDTSIVAVVHAALDTSRANSAFQGADDTKLLSR